MMSSVRVVERDRMDSGVDGSAFVAAAFLFRLLVAERPALGMLQRLVRPLTPRPPRARLQHHHHHHHRHFTSGWFGVAVTAFVASTKLSYVEPG